MTFSVGEKLTAANLNAFDCNSLTVASRETPGVYHGTSFRGTAHTFSASGFTNVDTSLDITIAAAAGDVIQYSFDTYISAGTNIAHFIAYTLNGATAVNPLTDLDVFGPGFWGTSDAMSKSYTWTYTTVAGDIFSSQVEVGLFCNTAGANRTIIDGNIGMRCSLVNLGPEVS